MESESTEVSSTAGIDDLISEQMGGPTPEPVAQETVGAETQPSSVSETPVPQEAPQAQVTGVQSPEAIPDSQSGVKTPIQPQTYKLGDRDYTAQELQAALTTAQQFPHLQGKYQELKEMAERQFQPQQQVHSQPAQVGSQEQWLQQVQMKYQPEIKALTEKGLISKDFATLFPAELSQMLAYRDGYGALAQKVQQMEQGFQQRQHQEQTTGLVNDLSRNMEMIASSGEAFAPLKDPNEMRGFFQYLYQMDPKVFQLRDPQFLAGQYVAYKKDTFLQNAQAQRAQAAQTNQARFAKADAGTGSRPPGGFQEPPKSPLDQMVDEFWGNRNS